MYANPSEQYIQPRHRFAVAKVKIIFELNKNYQNKKIKNYRLFFLKNYAVVISKFIVYSAFRV